jgi:WD40 repeat protein
MTFFRLVAALTITASISSAQSISIDGIVKDASSRTPLSGVVVYLSRNGIADTTDAAGAFHLSNVSVGDFTQRRGVPPPSVGKNGRLFIDVEKNEQVSVQIFSLNGRLLSSIREQCLPGSYELMPFVNAAGVYLYRVSVGGRTYSMKFVASGRGAGRTLFRAGRPEKQTAAGGGGTAKRAIVSDTLVAAKDGWYPSKVAVASIASNVEILLGKVSLKNGVKPGLMTGMTNQGKSFSIRIRPDGRTIDSVVIPAVLSGCSQGRPEYTFTLMGPMTIPENGVVTLGDTVSLVFLDSSVSGTFSIKQSMVLPVSETCYNSEIIYTGGGYIVQMVPYSNQTFGLSGPVALSTILFTLTVNQPGGKVTKSPDKPLYFPGDIVTLKAEPDSAHHFSSWSADLLDSSGATARVIMNGNKTVSENFAENFRLILKGTNCTFNPWIDWPAYRPGDTVVVIAYPTTPGLCFDGWIGDTLRTVGNLAWILMDSTKTIIANYLSAYTLSTSAQNGGIVRKPNHGCFSIGAADTVMLTAVPHAGFRLYSWSGDLLRTSKDTAWVVMDTSQSVTATFVPNNVRWLFPDTGWLSAVAISADGSKVLIGFSNGRLKLFDARTGTLVHMFGSAPGGIETVAFSSDGSRILSGGNKYINVWDALADTLIRTIPDTGNICSAVFSPDGQKILTGSDRGRLQLRDVNTAAIIQTFVGPIANIWSMCFSADGAQVLAGSDTAARLWETATGTLVRTIGGHTDAVRSVALSPDGTKILTGSLDKTAKLWDKASGALLQTFKDVSFILAAAFVRDGTWVWTGSSGFPPKLWDVNTGTIVKTCPVLTMGENTATVFSIDGTLVLEGYSSLLSRKSMAVLAEAR